MCSVPLHRHRHRRFITTGTIFFFEIRSRSLLGGRLFRNSICFSSRCLSLLFHSLCSLLFHSSAIALRVVWVGGSARNCLFLSRSDLFSRRSALRLSLSRTLQFSLSLYPARPPSASVAPQSLFCCFESPLTFSLSVPPSPGVCFMFMHSHFHCHDDL